MSPPPSGGGDATGGVVPYKNWPALLAYYLGIFSLFPCIGLALAIPALVLGIMGLQRRRKNPAIKGSVHAWIGIVLGGFFTLVWGAVGVLVIIALIAESNR
ncbi:DUF4190 domain-containing protein [Lignipirellula cremea]|uniref:DUF4190 domain-containing protein n=1 Tax=Lignipirellula cremea TaxID=2528010 RepID=A0A518DPQ8_9BACT|nr:DUF4190 domain-containing protein [Lignipirellula cremea]QDU93803.1 hypothetical protein Pla8534_15860 [Lignipirellula cremea]